MPDVFTKAQRSEVMSRIRGRGNKDTELALVRLLRAHKISGWRRHVRVAVDGSWLRVESGRKQRRTSPKTLTPSPSPIRWARVASDSPQRGEGVRRGNSQPSTLNPQLTVRPDFVFKKLRTVIFVDGCFWHGCPKHATKPKNNRAFWQRKLSGNRARDAVVTWALRRAGWRVLRIWEHDLSRRREARLIPRIRRALAKNLPG